MADTLEIFIKRIIVHILDTNLQIPIISDEEHPIDNDVINFISKHIYKVLKDDDLKNSNFLASSKIKEICENIIIQYDKFSIFTGEIANRLYEIMIKNIDIPSADLICTLFELNNVLYLGILKLNYKNSYIHYVDNLVEGKQNKLIKQKTSLPSENQRIDECALINLKDFSIKLIEKEYPIDGEKLNYFSNMFLCSTGDISISKKIKIFNKATENFNKKNFGDDFTKDIDVRKAVSKSIEENNEIDIECVAQNVYRNNPDMKESYVKCIEEAGLKEKSIMPSKKLIDKNYTKQMLKTDTGIEINVPMEYYSDKEKIEFITNTDGTISIIIKNISKISNK